MGGSMKDVQFKELDSMYGKVADTLQGADPSSLANKVGRVARTVEPGEPASASLETIQELTKENESSQEQIQAQDGFDDALKRRLQKLNNFLFNTTQSMEN
ncbi:PREDICTED: monothiol [Prunus dulcis]|uniref:PREDICTED: monothiol n=1 Tax=Prunus dulcis TaxID=3755 RepID=A0A5E4F8Y4_PRUDU|nr:hypothetical protein L3X38_021326 [Prunus dulcis]VVA24495.1 PREDICTED: monothiol [Prunus dulcis]